MLKVNDFFCGAGGVGLGFKNAGFEIAGAWDFDKYAVMSYAHNVDEKVQLRNIKNMHWYDIPKADVWFFGFPCQDVSVAKNNGKGLEGEKSGLFYEIMRLLDEVIQYAPDRRPRVIVAENVKNIKRWLAVVENEYSARGYKFSAELENSIYFEVPQNRQRVLMVGVLETEEKEFIFPKKENKTTLKFADILEREVAEKYYIHKPYHLFDKPRQSVIGLLDIKGLDIVKRIYKTDGYAPTLTTSQGGYRQPKIIDEKGLRKATPREYARLQGFPDSYEQIVSDAQFYKQMGNAVTVTVAYAFAMSIKEMLES